MDDIDDVTARGLEATKRLGHDIPGVFLNGDIYVGQCQKCLCFLLVRVEPGKATFDGCTTLYPCDGAIFPKELEEAKKVPLKLPAKKE